MKRSLLVWMAVAVLLLSMAFPVYAADSGGWTQVGGYFGATYINGNITLTHCLAYLNNTLYADSSDGSGVWYWNGKVWSQVGNPPGEYDGGISCLANINGLLYVGLANSKTIWSWDGKNWSKVAPLGTSPSGRPYFVNCLADINGLLCVGMTDGTGVWAWDGKSWSQLGSPFGLNYPANICSLLTVNNTLYAGTNLGVWVWDGKAWSQVGNLSNRTVWSLTSINNTLYAGTDAGLWTWDGKNWTQIDFSNNIKNIWSLLNANNQLYAGFDNLGIWSLPISQIDNISNINDLPISQINNTPDMNQTDSQSTIKIIVNGNELPGEPPLINVTNRILLPSRDIAEALGCTVNWDNDTQQMTIQKQGYTVIMTIGQADYTVNGVTKSVDIVPINFNNKTFIPIRALSEALNCTVNWDQSSQTVSITSN